MNPPQDSYYGVFVRLLEDGHVVDSEIADAGGCADLDAPPGEYQVNATFADHPVCRWHGEQAVSYGGGQQDVQVAMRKWC